MIVFDIEPDVPEWLKKCLSCKHCYKVKDDDDEIRCRARGGCKYKPYKKEVKANEVEL